MFIKRVAVVCVFALGALAHAEVKTQMVKFHNLMSELSPYLMNEAEYRKTENKEKVKG